MLVARLDDAEIYMYINKYIYGEMVNFNESNKIIKRSIRRFFSLNHVFLFVCLGFMPYQS